MSDDLDFDMEVTKDRRLDKQMQDSSEERASGSSVSHEVEDLPEIEKVPSGWELSTVGGVAQSTVGGGTPSKSNEDYWGGEIPWASVKDLDGTTVEDTEDSITEEGVENSATNLIPSGSVIISTRMTVGEAFMNLVDMAINQDLKAIRSDQSQVNTHFLTYALRQKDGYLKSLGRGTTVSGITTADLERTHLALPSLPEQRKIASVLYTVDQAIQKTEAIIEQWQKIDRGLLQSTFDWRRGNIEQARKDGEIPTGWQTVQLKEIADVTMGSSPKSKYYNSEGKGLPFYQGADEFGDRYPTPDRWCSSPNKTGKTDDILMNIRSHTNVGKLNQCPHKCCIGRGLASITPKSVDGSFLFHHLRERERYVNAIASGSTFDSINSKELETLTLAVPSSEIQQQIGARMDSIHNLITRQKRAVQRYQKLKKGLMQDLLTGEVRTADKAIEVLDEVEAHG